MKNKLEANIKTLFILGLATFLILGSAIIWYSLKLIPVIKEGLNKTCYSCERQI